jgi:hypothetical protein
VTADADGVSRRRQSAVTSTTCLPGCGARNRPSNTPVSAVGHKRTGTAEPSAATTRPPTPGSWIEEPRASNPVGRRRARTTTKSPGEAGAGSSSISTARGDRAAACAICAFQNRANPSSAVRYRHASSAPEKIVRPAPVGHETITGTLPFDSLRSLRAGPF